MLIVNIIMLITVVLIVVSGCWLIQIIVSDIYKATLNYKSHKETVIVLEKDFKGAYTTTTHVRVGKVTVPQIHHHSEEYNVYVNYEGVTYRINDNELFEVVVIGEKTEVTVYEGYDRKGRIRNIYLTA